MIPKSPLRCSAFALVIGIAAAIPLTAQERIDEALNARIKMEAFNNSKVLDTIGYLTDVHAIRLASSPQFRAAAEWCRQKLLEWGFDRARVEPYPTAVRSWKLDRFSAEMTAPYYMPLIAYPRAFSRSTGGAVTREPVPVEISAPADCAKYKGKLKSAIVLNGKVSPAGPKFTPDARRLTDEDLRSRVQVMNPGRPHNYTEDEENWIKSQADQAEIRKFFEAEGVAMVIEPSRADGMALGVTGFGWWRPGEPQTYPTIILAKEQFNRVRRLLDRKIPVTLEFNLRSTFDDAASNGGNVIAEIPGSDPRLKDEVVLLGAHLDALPPGTGAVDDGGPCVILMEALRILKAVGAKPRRTIRIGLWDGEELDYYGSMGYVKQHYGDPETMVLKPEHPNVAAYFNLDSGIGRIRGIGLQGNELARPFFEAALKSWEYLGASVITVRNVGNEDHIPFDSVGLPVFPFVQDPLDYSRRIHTNLDVFEGVVEEDMQQAAAVVASVAYHAAMRDEKLPRKPLPAPAKLR